MNGSTCSPIVLSSFGRMASSGGHPLQLMGRPLSKSTLQTVSPLNRSTFDQEARLRAIVNNVFGYNVQIRGGAKGFGWLGPCGVSHGVQVPNPAVQRVADHAKSATTGA